MRGLRFFFLILFAVIHVEALRQNSYDARKDYHVWKEGYALTWDSYKGKVDNELLSDFEAITYVSFLPIGKTEDAKVVCVFDAKSSWTTSESQSQLNHQQIHFDLGELTEKSQRGIIEKNYELYSEDFLAYNEETTHGLDKAQQQVWATKISNSLKQLSEYKVD